MVSIETPPVKKVQEELQDAQAKIQSDIQTNTRSLQQRALELENTLRRAQSGDAATQQALQQTLNATRKELADVQKKLAK